MSLKKKRHAKNNENMDNFETQKFFEFDDNGKLIPLPIQFPESISNSQTKGNNNNNNNSNRPTVKLERLNLQEIQEDIMPVAKKRKSDNKVAKELFKTPVPKPRASIKYKKNSLPKQVNQKAPFKLENGIAPLKTPQLPTIKEKMKSNLFNIPEITVQSSSPERKLPKQILTMTPSEKEFLRLEQQFNVDINSIQSPMSDMCNLFKKTEINDRKDGIRKNKIEEIQKILKENDQDFKDLAKRQEQRMKKIFELLTDIDGTDKININPPLDSASKRRSSRLTNKLLSPTTVKEVDLRKAVLNNNVHKTQLISSPAVKKALDMYNNLRGDCSFLSTPKIDKTIMNLNSPEKSISRRLQKQCLLLQDTPLHK